jgi:hypothetical protein
MAPSFKILCNLSIILPFDAADADGVINVLNLHILK